MKQTPSIMYLLEYDDKGVFHSVAYSLNKHSSAQCNYDIYNKEVMANLNAPEKWRPECKQPVYLLQLLNNHKNCE